MVDRKTWQEFREAGLLWFINTILHAFGWAIVISADKGNIIEVYPARVAFRGFSKKSNDKGYAEITSYMAKHGVELKEELEREMNKL